MNEKITGSVLYGNLHAIHVLFRDGPKPYRTLAFTLDNGDLINVDIDDNGDPMGVEVVYLDSQTPDGIFRCGKDNKVKKEAIVRRLLSASTRLCMIHAIQESLTREVNQCLDVVRFGGMHEPTSINKVTHREVLCEDLETGKYTTKIIRKQDGEKNNESS